MNNPEKYRRIGVMVAGVDYQSLDHWVKACNIAANVGQIQAFRVLLKEATDQGKPLAWPHGGNHVIIGPRLNWGNCRAAVGSSGPVE